MIWFLLSLYWLTFFFNSYSTKRSLIDRRENSNLVVLVTSIPRPGRLKLWDWHFWLIYILSGLGKTDLRNVLLTIPWLDRLLLSLVCQTAVQCSTAPHWKELQQSSLLPSQLYQGYLQFSRFLLPEIKLEHILYQPWKKWNCHFYFIMYFF